MKMLLTTLADYSAAAYGSASFSHLWQKGVDCFKDKNYHGTIAYMDTLIMIDPEYGRRLLQPGNS